MLPSLHSLAAAASFLEAHQHCPAQPSPQQAAAWWSAWAAALAASSPALQQQPQACKAPNPPAAVTRIMQLLAAASQGGKLPPESARPVAASLVQMASSWQGPWPEAAGLVSLAAADAAFTSAAVAAVQSLADEVTCFGPAPVRGCSPVQACRADLHCHTWQVRTAWHPVWTSSTATY